jgi:bifunctional DNA-binding transcriptional regulator/antitoxin component of YhaV-PrlF toxin-antitoxin module
MKTFATKLDRFGRMVLPKAVRERFGLWPGVAVEGEVVLRKPEQRTRTKLVQGVRVVLSPAEGDLREATRRLRMERARKLARL